MKDYRLLLPALAFWFVRVEVIAPKQVVTLIAIALIALLFLGTLQSVPQNLVPSFAGVIFAGVIALAVNLIFPIPAPQNFVKIGQIRSGEDFGALAVQWWQIDFFDDLLQAIHLNFRFLLSEFSRETAGILYGIVLGDERLIPKHLSEQVKLAGLQHLVAISGAHISLLTGIAVFCFGRRKPKLTAIFAGLFLVSLIALVGLSASVLRAAIMGVILLLALAFRRGSSTIGALSIGVILGVTFWPHLARGVGFQMSVVATAAIVICVPQILRINAIKQRLWLQCLVVPLVAGTATIPLAAGLQPQLSLFAVLANLAVAPVISIITLLGLIAAFLSCWIAPLASLFLFPCAIGAWWVQQVANWATMISVVNISPWFVMAIQLLFLGALICFALWLNLSDIEKIDFAQPKRAKGENRNGNFFGCAK